jgi:hypothetical protein
MSLLSRMDDGIHSVLIVITKLLREEGSMPRDTLTRLLCPPDIVLSPRLLTRTLTRWLELGYFVEDNGEIRIADTIPAPPRGKTVDAYLPAQLRDVIFRSENNENFWSNTKSKAADFTRATAWCLAQDAYRFAPSSHEEIFQLAVRQLSEELNPFRQKNTFADYKALATFYGFGWESPVPKARTWVPDPTRMIAEELPHVFESERELTARRFLERLADRLPVLDGGIYRKKVEKKINRKFWSPPTAGSLSTSLSRSLWAFFREGTLQFSDSDDFGAADDRSGAVFQLIGQDGRPVRRITHVVYLGGRR